KTRCNNEQSTNNNNRQPLIRKEFDRQSPVFVRAISVKVRV
ncbi:unnamed protein product, partial [Adineta steineri]